MASDLRDQHSGLCALGGPDEHGNMRLNSAQDKIMQSRDGKH